MYQTDTHLKIVIMSGMVAQVSKALAAQPDDDLSLIPGIYKVKGEKCLTSTHMSCGI